MRSSYLSLVPATLICAAALSTRAAANSAEEVRYDALGNMIWDTVASVKEALPSLGRPDFSGINIESGRKDAEEMMAAASDAWAQVEEEVAKAAMSLEEGAFDLFDMISNGVKEGAKEAKSWVHHGTVSQDGITYEKISHPSFPKYKMRITSENAPIPGRLQAQVASAKGFCDDTVKSVSGYLDISDTKHLWFIFFESRNKPKTDPLVLWLNGGPGCSSSTGLLFELGPCKIVDETTVKRNKNSWTNVANMIFLDQPASGVGFSYSEDGVINNTPTAAEDVYAFLQLFISKFPQYSKLPFSIAGESYGGRYLPLFANHIWEQNKALQKVGSQSKAAPQHINLDTVLIGNGLTVADVQFPAVYDFACGADNKYRLFDPESSTCTSLMSKGQTCKSLVEQCYKYDSTFTCTPAALYCWSSMYKPMQETGLNLYDVRKTCDREKDGPLCYPQMEAIEKYLNQPDIKKQLGVPSKVDFTSCNMQVNQAFLLHGDSMHDSSKFLVPLVEDGIRLLIYVGAADAMCSLPGNYQWLERMATNDTSFAEEYRSAAHKPFVVDGKTKGYVRSASKTVIKADGSVDAQAKTKAFGNIAFVGIDEAGHMVPTDQPEAALDMFTKWLANEALDSK